MRIHVQVEIETDADSVFAYIADLANNPEWQSGVASTEWVGGSPLRVGARCIQHLDDGSSVEYEVTAVELGRSLTIQSTSDTAVPSTITRSVQVLNESRCRVNMDLVGRVRGWRLLLTPLIKRLIRSSIQSDYRRLQRKFETAESED